jgi:diguanylate cyclase (GGDEF)-like protein
MCLSQWLSSLYKDTVPVFVAALTTILHHLIFNYLQFYDVSLFGMPIMVFNYGCGMDIVLLHGFFVVMEALVLGYIIKLQIEHAVELNRTETEVLSLNAELKHSSLHDDLTGLANRQNLYNRMEMVTANANRHKDKFALLFLDLDRFKNINDTLGHDIGDLLLQAISVRLNDVLRENDLIARIGGDEFVIIITDVQNESSVMECINKILEIFRHDTVIKGHSLKVSASIGVAMYPDDARDIKELMKYADIAMYKAKENGRDNFYFFTQSMNKTLHDEVFLINDMQRALNSGEFKLYYQPKVDTQTNSIVGAEALIRWEHSQKGMIYPDVFIRLAEGAGFIVKLGKWIVDDAVRFIGELSELGYDDLNISINVSSKQVKNFELYHDLRNALDKYSIRGKQLSIEITESVMMEDAQNAAELLQKIKTLGINIYLDDFGTGYSSLSYLNKFPIDTLKIDKSFIDDISKEGDNGMLLLNTILAMGQTLGMDVIAEGVEEEFQLDYLKSKQCKYFQGYLMSRPIAKEEFLRLLETNRLSNPL